MLSSEVMAISDLSRTNEVKYKQGQGNQCQTPGVKFEELTGWKKGKNGKKLEETENLKKKQDQRSKPLPTFCLLC